MSAFAFADATGGKLERRHWGLLVGATAVIHVASLLVAQAAGCFSAIPNTDHTPYMREVLAQGYPQPRIWPPGFSYYLAFKWTVTESLGLPYWSAKYFVDIFFVVLAAVLATQLGRLLTRNRWLAMASGLGLVAAPIFALGSAMEEAAVFFQPFFLGSLLLVVRELQRDDGPRALPTVGAGLLMGVACQIRPNPQFILAALALAAVAFRARHRFPRARLAAFLLLFAGAQVLPGIPWTLHKRNVGQGGALPFGSVSQLFYGGVAHEPDNRIAGWTKEHYATLDRSLPGMAAFTARWLREDPAAFAGLALKKVARTWYASDSRRWDLPTLLLHLPLWLLAVAGFVRWRREERRSPERWLVALVVVYFWLQVAALYAIARYTAPVYGFIGVLAGIPVLRLLGWVKARRPAPGSDPVAAYAADPHP